MFSNIPEVKLGIIAVSRDCFIIDLSERRRGAIVEAFIPEYPVGTAAEIAKMIGEFKPIACALIGLSQLKLITFGPRPQDFFACNAPIKGLYEIGVEIEENSELDLLVAYKAHANDPRLQAVRRPGREVSADPAPSAGAQGQ